MSGGDHVGFIVLLVDDEEMVRNIGCRLLGKLGYEAHAVADGAAAILFCKSADPAPDCLVLDYSMPNLNGAETLAAIREFLPEIPAILATGYATEVLGIDTADGTWNAVVTKPFRLDSLTRALDAVRGRG